MAGWIDETGDLPRHVLKSPTALATFSGSPMSRGEALSLDVGTRVLARNETNIYLAEIRGLDRHSGMIAVRCPAWPDDPEEWVLPSQLYARSGAAPAVLAAMEAKLRECTDGWAGFRYALGDLVTVRCGSVARTNGVVTGRALRQFDPRDPARDNSHHAFVPTYLVRVDVETEEYYPEEMVSPINVFPSASSPANTRGSIGAGHGHAASSSSPSGGSPGRGRGGGGGGVGSDVSGVSAGIPDGTGSGDFAGSGGKPGGDGRRRKSK
eukprot:CAMPEP_0206311246 /NCGR_PEP_ID=MMETSP0106_2-20121207/13353_1 /ASSEMBLY_ACC=CAM_ASM_000206 /TAXON_ID=81532 /ORGANISM="Acanthoeca-like sp., Strain 10tr" /LENGTH=265 /DNA_ID=CAMNT_0053742465 /DNA_START=100 /DNA_END=894 /DNA_ORIENTATION=-